MVPPLGAGEWVAFGVIGRAHGVRGELRLVPFQPGGELPEGARLRLVKKSGEIVPVTVRSLRSTHQALLISFARIDDRDAAIAVSGARLEIEAASLPKLAEDELYLFELVGASALDEREVVLGVVEGLYDNRGQDMVVLRSSDGAERLLPLGDETLRRFERERRRVIFRVPEGLWDVSS